MSTFNFRIGTKVTKTPLGEERTFDIIECYYDKQSHISQYGELNQLRNWESVEDLKATYDKIKSAFDKPILDLDNWPKEYQP
jgi:hypothetical protein